MKIIKKGNNNIVIGLITLLLIIVNHTYNASNILSKFTNNKINRIDSKDDHLIKEKEPIGILDKTLITDIYIVSSTKERKYPCPIDWVIADPINYEGSILNLNEGANGEFIYLCTKRVNEVNLLENNFSYLSDFYIINTLPKDKESDFNKARQLNYKCLDQYDLNKKAGGDYIYLCYKKERLVLGETLLQRKNKVENGIFKLATMIGPEKNECTKKSNGYNWNKDGTKYKCLCNNLNEGTAGEIIYLCWSLGSI